MDGPCLSCQDVDDHLTIHNFKSSYEIDWDQHGECRPQGGNQHDGRVEQMVRDIFLFVALHFLSSFIRIIIFMLEVEKNLLKIFLKNFKKYIS